MVDIVITYLDDNKKWRKEYNYWKNYEIDSGIIEETSKQAFGKVYLMKKVNMRGKYVF